MDRLTNKKVKIMMDDLGQPATKQGIVLSHDLTFVELKGEHRTEFLPIYKILRIEVLE